MEKTTVLKTGKYISLIVMIITAGATMITGATGYLTGKDYGQLIIAFGVFLIALRNYLKDTYLVG
jgi:hypothetical protein